MFNLKILKDKIEQIQQLSLKMKKTIFFLIIIPLFFIFFYFWLINSANKLKDFSSNSLIENIDIEKIKKTEEKIKTEIKDKDAEFTEKIKNLEKLIKGYEGGYKEYEKFSNN